MWSIPERQDRAELLDIGVGTAQDVKDNFADLSRINRYLGGISALTRHIYPAFVSINREDNPITLLDIGTGSAEIPLSMAEWAHQKRIKLRLLALDLSPRNLALAREDTNAEIELVHADALQLPLAPGSCDIVMSSLFLHHLTPECVVEGLRAPSRCARTTLGCGDVVRDW